MNYLIVIFLLITGSLFPQEPASEEHRYLLIDNVSIISMNPSDRQVVHGSVLIRDSIIIYTGDKHLMDIPRGTKIINCKGKYLIPGLWDSHVHLCKSTRQALPEYLRYGVTSVRDMGGDPDTLKSFCRDIAKGILQGPRILYCGPVIENTSFMDWAKQNLVLKPGEKGYEDMSRTRVLIARKEDAKRLIDSVVSLGVDFIKVHDFQDTATYCAIAKAVRESGLKLDGHAPWGMDPLTVAAAGQRTYEHGWYPSLSGLSENGVDSVIDAFRNNKCVLVPTLSAWVSHAYTSAGRIDSLVNGAKGTRDPRIGSLPADLLGEWKVQIEIRKKGNNVKGYGMKSLNDQAKEVYRFYKSGVKVLAGTDVAVVLLFPGASLHDELRYFVEKGGMSPYEALTCATIAPSEVFGFGNSRGTIEKGKLADLVLLNSNPLTDIHNTTSIHSVIMNGKLVNMKGR